MSVAGKGLTTADCGGVFYMVRLLVGETHGTSGQCASFSLIDAGSVLLPAYLFVFWQSPPRGGVSP
jgi:hypothetical protein